MTIVVLGESFSDCPFLVIFLQQEIQTASYGQDVNTVEQLYKEHQNKHEDIMNMRENVERACKEAVSNC